MLCEFPYEHFVFSRVITGYLILHRVNGLKTLRHMLPNLAIIKGEQLLYHYALILYQMFDMVEVNGIKGLSQQKNVNEIFFSRHFFYFVDWFKIISENSTRICFNTDVSAFMFY